MLCAQSSTLKQKCKNGAFLAILTLRSRTVVIVGNGYAARAYLVRIYDLFNVGDEMYKKMEEKCQGVRLIICI